MNSSDEQQVLVALRRIARAMDLYSRRLRKTVGLTAPQLLLLQAIRNMGAVSISSLSAEISLSQATVTSIIDRLEARGLVQRTRSDSDRRIVHATLTSAGDDVVAAAPTPLQEEFAAQFRRLAGTEKAQLITSLQRIAALMHADEIDASPVLHTDADIQSPVDD
jgi:DNA-binding MarR family transcriptional regulator